MRAVQVGLWCFQVTKHTLRLYQVTRVSLFSFIACFYSPIYRDMVECFEALRKKKKWSKLVAITFQDQLGMAIKTRYLLFGKHYRGIEIKYSRESDDILKSLNRNKRIDLSI